MKRRGFLARVAAVLAAPVVAPRVLTERSPQECIAFARAKREPLYFLNHEVFYGSFQHGVKARWVKANPELRARVQQTTRDFGAHIDRIYFKGVPVDPDR